MVTGRKKGKEARGQGGIAVTQSKCWKYLKE